MLVHSLWQFALVALVAIVLQGTLRRRSAAMRYWVLLAAMAAMVLAPAATWFSPWSADAGIGGRRDQPEREPQPRTTLCGPGRSCCAEAATGHVARTLRGRIADAVG